MQVMHQLFNILWYSLLVFKLFSPFFYKNVLCEQMILVHFEKNQYCSFFDFGFILKAKCFLNFKVKKKRKKFFYENFFIYLFLFFLNYF